MKTFTRKAEITKESGYFVVRKSVWNPELGIFVENGEYHFKFEKNARIYKDLYLAHQLDLAVNLGD